MEQFDRSSPADIVIPESTGQLLRRRAAEHWGHAACVRDVVLVWPVMPAADPRPIGAFEVSWSAPFHGEATIRRLAWDEARGSEELVRQAINYLAGWPVAWQESASAA